MGCGKSSEAYTPSVPEPTSEPAASSKGGPSKFDAPPPTQVNIVCPAGAGPGTVLNFSIDDGRVCKAVVPDGIEEGQMFSVMVPARHEHAELRRELPNFQNLLQVFKWCDPNDTGNITDHGRFRKIAALLADDEDDMETVWRKLDLDGNGSVNFPEFVEWAEGNNVNLPVGVGDDSNQGGVAFPKTWTGPKDDENWNTRTLISCPDHQSELQELLNKTYKNVWTRDRKKSEINKVPKGYDLAKAMHSENFRDWRGYYLKRHLLMHNCAGRVDFVQRTALTNAVEALRIRHSIRGGCNEWLLFHGTNPEAAEQIMGGDFHFDFAGSNTGTLYGRGTYFAESITKADEYSMPGKDGLCCVLVCRVVGGHVLYNDEVQPDAETLQQSVLSGSYNSILGDREKCRNTYKEYVVFDADQVYVEYALFYKRVY